MAVTAPHHITTPRPTPAPLYNMQIGVTPLPVAIQERPPDPLWAYWVPGLGLLFGALAAIFAGWALKRISDQIVLARKQLQIANEQIELANEQIDIANLQSQIANDSLKATRDSVELAQKDFNATIEALGITKEQAQKADAERAKRPQLMLAINNNLVGMKVEAGYFKFLFYIYNAGDLLTDGAFITILFPSDGVVDRLETLDMFARTHEELTAFKEQKRWWPGNPRKAEGKNIYYYNKHIEQKVLPGTSMFFAYLDIQIEPGTYIVQWNMVGSDGVKWPLEKHWGQITIVAEAD